MADSEERVCYSVLQNLGDMVCQTRNFKPGRRQRLKCQRSALIRCRQRLHMLCPSKSAAQARQQQQCRGNTHSQPKATCAGSHPPHLFLRFSSLLRMRMRSPRTVARQGGT